MHYFKLVVADVQDCSWMRMHAHTQQMQEVVQFVLDSLFRASGVAQATSKQALTRTNQKYNRCTSLDRYQDILRRLCPCNQS